jgi:AcrR family transcriptional regulator
VTGTAIQDRASDAPPRGQRADARRNRAKLLKAARTEFARHGLDAQIDDIARRAGVGVGTVYRHFPRKEDILRALAEARFNGLAEAALAALEADDPWEGFVEFMTYSAREVSEDRSLAEAIEEYPGICGQCAQDSGLDKRTDALVARAQAEGALRADIGGRDVAALVCGIGRAVRAGEGQPTMSWDRYLAIILDGLRRRED